MVDTLATLSNEQKQFYERNLLFRARQTQAIYKATTKSQLGQNMGNNVSFRRFNALGLSTTPLQESATPAGTNLSVTEVVVTVQEYGNYVTVSDALDLMAIDKVMTEASDVLGQNGGESVEAIIRNTLQAGTNVIYATGSTRAGIATSNPITLDLFRRAVTNLEANNTMKYGGSMENPDIGGGGTYVAFLHPQVIYDIWNDQELKNAMQYSSSDRLWNGEVGMLYNVRLIKTTLAPVFTGQGAAGANVYGTLIMGQNAAGAVDLAGKGKFELIVKPLGSAGADDPLNQRGSIGWKAWQAPVILNNNFMVRLETGATLG